MTQPTLKPMELKLESNQRNMNMRNKPCPCNSGSKYKKCCEVEERVARYKKVLAESGFLNLVRHGVTPCSADFVMPFGMYKGQSLCDISEENPGYIVWLADKGALKIETQFLDAVRRNDMEMDYIDPSDRWGAFRNDEA